jgi:hypothetical protein
MQLVCPSCGLSKNRTHLSMRLETCTKCAAEGREVYLVRPGSEDPADGRPPAGLSRVRELADTR